MRNEKEEFPEIMEASREKVNELSEKKLSTQTEIRFTESWRKITRSRTRRFYGNYHKNG